MSMCQTHCSLDLYVSALLCVILLGFITFYYLHPSCEIIESHVPTSTRSMKCQLFIFVVIGSNNNPVSSIDKRRPDKCFQCCRSSPLPRWDHLARDSKGFKWSVRLIFSTFFSFKYEQSVHVMLLLRSSFLRAPCTQTRRQPSC